MSEQLKNLGDWLFGGITVATVLGWLPHMAAGLSFIYMAIRIWETPTCRRLLKAVCARCAAWWEA